MEGFFLLYSICDPLRENKPLLIFYQNVAEACNVSQVKNGVHDQIFFCLKFYSLYLLPSMNQILSYEDVFKD